MPCSLLSCSSRHRLVDARLIRVACGFELRTDGTLKASDEVLDRLRKEQNSARKRAHAEAAAAREKLLSDALRELERSFAAKPQVVGGATAPPPLRAARQALAKFLATFDGQPAVGPLFLGLAALLRAQAADGKAQCWVVDRAAVLNGGDAFVKTAVPLLGQCGVRPLVGSGGAAATEEGRAAGDDEVALRVENGCWTQGELAALAAFVERKGKGSGFGARASGRVEADADAAFAPRSLSSLSEWARSVLSAWLTRLAP